MTRGDTAGCEARSYFEPVYELVVKSGNEPALRHVVNSAKRTEKGRS